MSVFDWLKRKPTQESSNVLQQLARSPIIKDWTNKYTCNTDLTRGLYHNTFPGMKLSGGLAYPPIAIPVNFMGLPIPKPADEEDTETAEILLDLVKQFADKMTHIHTFHMVDGTFWVWPFYSQKAGRLLWEMIDDDSVTVVVRDIETKEIIKLILDEEITLSLDLNKDVIIKRRRTFTMQEIVEEYFGTDSQLPADLKSVRKRNVFGIIPIPFVNNVDPGDVRGHSDYERIITDLKDYHDIDLARSTLLAKFQPKWVQGVQNAEEWIKNLLAANGWSSASEIDIASMDLILNLTGQEASEILWPEKAHEAYSSTLEQKFMKIVEASGTPEIVWGLKTKNNNASAEVSLDGLIKYTHGKQDQITKSYQRLFEASLRIIRFINFDTTIPDIEIEWNDLDAVSDEVRSIIFKNIADGISKLMSVAGITDIQLHGFYSQMYPTITEDDIEDFKKGLTKMARHKQYVDAPYAESPNENGEDVDNEFDLPDVIPEEPGADDE